ncbi:MAG: thiamine phosphate synthase [Kiritimatiellae bacterium]|nr:thiamine phosphate synthase [Kiritimatiellia bacterium]
MTDFGFYLVMTNPKVGYAACAQAAVDGGVRIIQLRMKDAPRDEIVSVGRTVRDITRGTETLFIVNDDPSIAAEVGADGVHVGQGDMPVPEVRRLYPSLRIVGLSTHSPEQALASLDVKPDYIGVGPVWATPTKKIPDPVLGIETAMRMVRSVPYPAVAIGGIDASRLPELLQAGARNYAVVREVCGVDDPLAAIRNLKRIYDANVR